MADYPTECEDEITLADGAVICLRPIRPEDGEREERFFDRVSEESAYWRFFHAKRMLTPAEVRHLTTVDYEGRMAIIAVHHDEMVAVARFDVVPGRMHGSGRVGEVAFLVEDDFQGRGVGRELLSRLVDYARKHGVSAFEAHVLPTNHRMFRLFEVGGCKLLPQTEPNVYLVEFPPFTAGEEGV